MKTLRIVVLMVWIILILYYSFLGTVEINGEIITNPFYKGCIVLAGLLIVCVVLWVLGLIAQIMLSPFTYFLESEEEKDEEVSNETASQ